MFSNRMLEARKKKGLTQKEAAEQASIQPSTYSSYETNKKIPPLDVALRVAGVLGVSVEWLCGKEKDKSLFPTCGDVARALLQIKDTFLSDAAIGTRYGYTDGGGKNISYYVVLELKSETLFAFFEKVNKFDEMRKGSPDEKELVDAWIATKLRELDKDEILPF